ncbi:MAG: lytic transglycosylase domain-containing protein [Rhodospirillaceae bacterium]
MTAFVKHCACLLFAVLFFVLFAAIGVYAAEIIRPLPKPNIPLKLSKTIPAPILPSRKPPYYGPFGRDYSYLLNEIDRDSFSQALTSAKSRRWSRARNLAAKIETPLPGKIITWLYLRETGARTSFKSRAQFIEKNQTWPDIRTLRIRAEEVVDQSMSPSETLEWFKKFPPLTGPGLTALAKAHQSLGNETLVTQNVRKAWLEGNFTRSQERRFLRSFGSILKPKDHLSRLNRLLWSGRVNSARRLVRRVTPDHRKLAEARIALITSSYGVDAAIAKVPKSLRNDSGLVYDRLKWRRKRMRYESAAELLLDKGIDQIRPDLWWRERRILSRDALAKGEITTAYKIAAGHSATDALSVFEAEWFAGWIQLQFLNDPEASLPHFYRVYDTVEFPVSLSRGAYWAGRALEAAGDLELARNWYEKAAVHITTYYGQLALAKLTGDTLPQLPMNPMPTISERNSFHQTELARAVRMLAEVGNKDALKKFVLAAARISDFATERHLTAEMVAKFNRIDLSVRISRKAEQEHIILLEYGYPISSFQFPPRPEKALLLAIARQESNFDVGARSRAGARGLMQLMPATAKAVSKRIRERYDREALSIDGEYNIRLGSKYLEDLIDDFDGSYVMAIAGYNAGPRRVRRWIREFGDPRSPEIDPIDWVEQIPFTETRNYVQRVMENLQVYRAVLENTQQLARTLPEDLSRPIPIK